MTQKNRGYLEEEYHLQVAEMWECGWQKLKKTELLVQQYVNETFKCLKPSYTKKKVTPTEDDIVASIDDNTLIGLVECDIHVPVEHKE